MSSTDRPDSAADPIAAFHDEQLAPAAQALRDRGVAMFPTGPDASVDSYYEPCPPGDDPFVQLEPGDVEAWLREHWHAMGLDELAAIAGPLFELAAELDTREEQSDEVAPEIYVMF